MKFKKSLDKLIISEKEKEVKDVKKKLRDLLSYAFDSEFYVKLKNHLNDNTRRD